MRAEEVGRSSAGGDARGGLHWPGEAFNAGYLAARLTGADAATAAGSARTLTAAVIRHPLAIVDHSVVPGE
ncbi:hypothetical protein ACFQ0O_14770 [Saccharopolyspora spinosporotrichia]